MGYSIFFVVGVFAVRTRFQDDMPLWLCQMSLFIGKCASLHMVLQTEAVALWFRCLKSRAKFSLCKIFVVTCLVLSLVARFGLVDARKQRVRSLAFVFAASWN